MPFTSTTLTDRLTGGIGSSYDRRGGRVLIAEWSGRITSIDVSGDYRVLGTGYGNLEDIEVSADGRWAVVTQRDGAVLRVDLAAADAAGAQTVASGLTAPHQVVLVRDRLAYLVEFARTGRLLSVNLTTGAVRTLATGLVHAVGLQLSADHSTAYVTEQGTAGGRLTTIVLATGARRTVVSGLVNPFMMAWAGEDRTALLIAERDPANRVVEVSLRRGLPPIISPRPPIGTPLPPFDRRRPPFERVDRFPPIDLFRRPGVTPVVDPTPWRPSSVQQTDFGTVVVCDKEVLLVGIGRPARVDIAVGGTFFPGEYRRVGATVHGVAFDDLDFVVTAPERMGQVSYSRDDGFDPLHPEIMVLAGSSLGVWQIEARRRSDGAVLGVADLETTDVWAGADGPPIWFEGTSQPAVTGSTWGGTDGLPQNLDIHPQLGTRRVAMVLVDTAGGRYPADASAIAQRWEDETINGVSIGGTLRSTRAFLTETSGLVDDGAGNLVPRFDIALDGVHGPVQLSGEWEDYFETISPTDGRWRFKTALIQAAATVADDLIDFSTVDSFVVIVRTVAADGTTAAKMAWPYASGMTVATADGDQSIRFVVMPDDWAAQSTRENHETLAHELGHNLGLPDLYMDVDDYGAIAARDVTGWDTMSWEGRLGHYTTPLKMRLGWLEEDDIRTFDFQNSGAVSEEVVLHASSLGSAPDGRFSAVEVRIADGWNYYFEYRSEQGTGVGDEELPSDRRVIGTDVIHGDFTAPIVRRQVILLPNDPDGDGPVLDVGEDYEETDATTPTAPADFRVEVLETTDDWARIRVEYGANSQPDPSIRPWPGTGMNAWQSPDIEVFNDRNRANPEFRNLPWTAHANTIVARVRNSGNLTATGVRVNFSVKNFTTGSAVETSLGFDIRDIPAGDTVEFSYDGWVPPAGQHFCVVARIPLHVNSDDLATVEITELNNTAQSNYTEFISAEASPPRRQRTFVTVANPYPEPTTAYLTAAQTNPFYRSYLAASSVALGPGEERKVELMFEALHGTPDLDRMLKHDEDDVFLRRPNLVGVSGTIDDPLNAESDHPLPTGGVVVRVRTGSTTHVRAGADANVVTGTVTAANDVKVEGGSVIVAIRKEGESHDLQTRVAEVHGGHFFVEFDTLVHGAGFIVTAEYLGRGQWAPSEPFTFTS
ncbi:hypothetical protein [Microbacterium sp.]|uniref:hypothetical protein n=1 Tax=Microbacterium sp. TaxID=51671 RepID=UPI003A839107